MAQVNAKCPYCGETVLIEDSKEASVCPNCKDAFITEKAITVYNNSQNQAEITTKKRRNVLKSLGKGLLMVLECIGYLLYVITFMWLFFDITNDIKKK